METSAHVHARVDDRLPELLSVRQAAAFLGISPSVLYEDIAAGRFSIVVRVGGRMKVPLRRLLSWLDGTDAALSGRPHE